jgi:hypothetical protein
MPLADLQLELGDFLNPRGGGTHFGRALSCAHNVIGEVHRDVRYPALLMFMSDGGSGDVIYGQHAGITNFDTSIKRDTFGNVDGPEYDLSPDGTFAGQNIAVLQLYSGEGFTFAAPRAALQRKGFTVHIWTAMPTVADFEAQLGLSCQLWVISGPVVSLTPAHIAVVQKMVDSKKGLFIWADNDPYTADANLLLRGLTQTSELSINGNFMGDTVLKEAAAFGDVGFSSHLLTTGLESLYEGITISSVAGPKAQHRAIIHSSDGKVVTACHDRRETRIMIDGGYTRLMEDRWARTAGTARFVTNAACWLFNFEGRPHGSGDDGEPEMVSRTLFPTQIFL